MHSRDLKETNSTYYFGGLKEERPLGHFMLKFVKQLTDFQYHRVSFAKCTQLERSPGTDTGQACGFAVGEMKPRSQ